MVIGDHVMIGSTRSTAIRPSNGCRGCWPSPTGTSTIGDWHWPGNNVWVQGPFTFDSDRQRNLVLISEVKAN